MTVNKSSVCILTTVSASIKAFYRGQIQALNEAAITATVICAPDAELKKMLPEAVEYMPVNFKRTMSPLADLASLCKLIGIFRKERFDAVQYSTPKASLLSSIAAFTARVPIRIYLLWGLYYEGQSGFSRTIHKTIEKLICRLSTHVVPISVEMVDHAVSEKLVSRKKLSVILNGSACGVDLDTFDPEKWSSHHDSIRDKYHIPAHATVIGTVARLTGDKGINELVWAFDKLSEEISGIYLLLVGEQEEKDRLSSETINTLNRNNRIRLAGWQDNPLPYYAAMDIFCLPTYREGFGEVNLEAQAMALPVVSTDVIGPRESVERDKTGFLVPPRDAAALLEPLRTLTKDLHLRKQMGSDGRRHVQEKFDRKEIIKEIVKHRLELLSK